MSGSTAKHYTKEEKDIIKKYYPLNGVQFTRERLEEIGCYKNDNQIRCFAYNMGIKVCRHSRSLQTRIKRIPQNTKNLIINLKSKNYSSYQIYNYLCAIGKKQPLEDIEDFIVNTKI